MIVTAYLSDSFEAQVRVSSSFHEVLPGKPLRLAFCAWLNKKKHDLLPIASLSAHSTFATNLLGHILSAFPATAFNMDLLGLSKLSAMFTLGDGSPLLFNFEEGALGVRTG